MTVDDMRARALSVASVIHVPSRDVRAIAEAVSQYHPAAPDVIERMIRAGEMTMMGVPVRVLG